jgi:hypothetical protein
MKTINIKGKEYITVNERLKHFRSQKQYANWRINEEVEILNENEGVFKVTVYNSEGEPMASAHAQEYRDNTYINKTSFVENGFTSALGRALGYLGIGIDTSIASGEEMQNAVTNQQQDSRSWLTEAQLQKTLQGTKGQAEKVLTAYKMKKEYREQITTKFKL